MIYYNVLAMVCGGKHMVSSCIVSIRSAHDNKLLNYYYYVAYLTSMYLCTYIFIRVILTALMEYLSLCTVNVYRMNPSCMGDQQLSIVVTI